MTPTNPNNGNPLILRIMDALGVLHQVAPVNHTHKGDEVTGITHIGGAFYTMKGCAFYSKKAFVGVIGLSFRYSPQFHRSCR